MMTMTPSTLTDISGMRVGHMTDRDAATGCTVILCPPGTVGGVDQRGGAPGTRETDLLRPLHLVEHVHAILLAGGSAYGLAAADGVMRYLEEQHTGYPVLPGLVVPIVPTAILFDLAIGRSDVRPDSDMGYAACVAATNQPVEQGSVGAGTGCRVGTLLGNDHATKGGIGSACMDFGNGLKLAALVAVNAIGDVLDEHGNILAGVRQEPHSEKFIGALNLYRTRAASAQPIVRGNTIIGVVATNAALTKEQTNHLAQMAQDGIAQTIRPAHTLFDGDTLFALSTSALSVDVNVVYAFAAEVMAQAIRNAVRTATSLAGVKAIQG
jgi:L-aminopeptidase/D-esterase-like protein